MISLPNNLTSILLRVLVFLGLFVVVTGILGPQIVPTKLLYGYGFFIYGNLGKMVILSSIIFLLMTWKRLIAIPIPKYKKSDILFVVVGFLLIPVFSSVSKTLLSVSPPNQNIPLYLLTHLLLISIPALMGIGAFGLPFLVKVARTFPKELIICAVLSVVLDIGVFQVWKLWPYLSNAVLYVVRFAFSLTFPIVKVFPQRTILVQQFAVRIEESCSGLDSLFLFSTLYAVIGYIDWKTLHTKKYVLFYIPAAIGLFLVNILRVYLIILIGVLISPDIALKLFHTYAGMILFLLYFGIFMKFFYRRMKK